MIRIALISDTHGWLDPQLVQYLPGCHELWHAGDFGDAVLPQLAELQRSAGIGTLRGVYGNIDGAAVRQQFPEEAVFECGGLRVLMRHIGGYPPRYNPATRAALRQHQPKLFIAGHSHILKVQYDEALGCLHMNPGAAGRHGWHHVRTLLRFGIADGRPTQLEVIELGTRGG
jgi:putative phosphoesterase